MVSRQGPLVSGGEAVNESLTDCVTARTRAFLEMQTLGVSSTAVL